MSHKQSEETLKYATDVRKFEIDLFWRRSLFFWGFIAAAFVAYAGLLHEAVDKDAIVFIACFGFICSLAWTLGNRGSKYWQEAWEKKVESVEFEVLGRALFSNQENQKNCSFWGSARYSVSRLTIALSDFTVLVWLALLNHVCPISNISGLPTTVIATFIYAFLMLVFGRSRSVENASL